MDSSAWDARYSSTDLLWSTEPNRFVEAELADLPAGRALDLACGEGRNAVWLATKGWRAVGVDFSQVAIERATALAGERGVDVEWVVSDVTTYEPSTGAFDAVLVSYLHLPAPVMAGVLGRAATALAPGGVLVVVGHADTNIAEGYGGPQDPGVLYGPDEVVAAVGGLVVVEKAERVRRPVETGHRGGDGGEVRDAIDVLVRAHRPAA